MKSALNSYKIRQQQTIFKDNLSGMSALHFDPVRVSHMLPPCHNGLFEVPVEIVLDEELLDVPIRHDLVKGHLIFDIFQGEYPHKSIVGDLNVLIV